MAEFSSHADWLQLHQEDIIDPSREIIDTHHHLWRHAGLDPYLLEDFRLDTGAGHNIRQSVFIECGAEYRTSGPRHLQPVGETEFFVELARRSELDGGAVIAAIVGHADLRHEALSEVLAEHVAAAEGRFRGIRHALTCAPDDVDLMIAGHSPRDLYANPQFQSGVRTLGASGLSYESWHYHFQNQEFLALSQAAPDTVMILDHFGTPLGVGPYASQRQEIFKSWQEDIQTLSRQDNVVAKLGGMAMPDNGFGWMGRATPPSSDEFVDAQADYYHHTIECFGPDRCMFESNFPVDKLSIAYPILWNAFKKIASRYSDSEQEALFSGTAKRVYRLE
ncbi:MAG: amidohydrolase family protein [Halioglobus sp.]